MSRLKILVSLVILIIPCKQFAQHTDQINSNRPGETMSAFAVGKTIFQLESGVYGIQEKHSLLETESGGLGFDMTIRYGAFLEKLEFIADIQYQNMSVTAPMNSYEKSGFKQSILGAKYLVYDPFKNYKKKVNLYSWKANHAFNWRQLVPAVSLFAGANFTKANNPYYFAPDAAITPKIVLIAQNHLGDGSWVFITNIIADYIGTDFPSYGYGITLTKGFNKKWSGFIENQGYKSDFYSDAIVRGGAAFLLHNNLQLDASISTSLKDTPSILYGGIGLSWRYAANYKEVRMKIEDNKKSKAQKKVEKKDRKRKDEVSTITK